jgi:hypothetical protein
MRFFHTKMCIPILLLIVLKNCAYLLSACLASEKKTGLYIVKAESIKGRLS